MELLRHGVDQLQVWWSATSSVEISWLCIGFVAQLMFSMRFIIQWIASERARASIVPEAFWYFSMFGGVLLLAYATYRVDPVFMLGQASGLAIYIRNIQFIRRGRQAEALIPSDASRAG